MACARGRGRAAWTGERSGRTGQAGLRCMMLLQHEPLPPDGLHLSVSLTTGYPLIRGAARSSGNTLLTAFIVILLILYSVGL